MKYGDGKCAEKNDAPFRFRTLFVINDIQSAQEVKFTASTMPAEPTEIPENRVVGIHHMELTLLVYGCSSVITIIINYKII